MVTIRKGEAWGDPVVSAAEGLRVATSDGEAVRGGRRDAVGLSGGDMARTMGGGAPGRLNGPHVRATVDLLEVTADGRTFIALAHVVARRSWWRGEVVMAMNAQFLGEYDVAPRSHPNDGRLDLLRVDPSMPLRARLQARTRARTGTHLPHPHITFASTQRWTAEFVRPLNLYVDGTRVARVRELAIVVLPDALIVHA